MLGANIYDIFIFNNSGVLTLGTGPVWTSSAAGASSRGTGAGTTQLTTINGINVNNNTITLVNGATSFPSVAANTATFLGSIFTDGGNTITCHRTVGQNRRWGLWNAFNRQPLVLMVTDPTPSWNYGASVVRPANNSTANQLTAFTGLAEEIVYSTFTARPSIAASSNNNLAAASIGFNSSTFSQGTLGICGMSPLATTVTAGSTITAIFNAITPLGNNNWTALESGNSGGASITWNGQIFNMLLQATWRG